VVPRRVILALLALAAPAHAASLDAEMGRALFNRQWVAAPSSTQSDDGLGPIYDARSCSACHVGAGAGPVAPITAIGAGMVVRLGNARGESDPVYGFQLQTKAIAGHLPEGAPKFDFKIENGLRVPALKLGVLNFGPLALDTHAALRRAPSLFGVGLLAKIPDREIFAQAAKEKNSDGVRGRPATLGKNIGRFGWKAAQADLEGQVGSALSRDIGLSTTAFPDPWGECSATEKACRAGPHGAEPGEVEVPDQLRDLIVAYLNSLPAPRAQAALGRGQVIFNQLGCNACHAIMKTADGKPVVAYTDLLLHDMGSALDDGIAEGNAKSNEWRTAPLWGLAARLKGGGLLHDGRARSVEEAIAWHGGEALTARGRFDALSEDDKTALVKFVEGL